MKHLLIYTIVHIHGNSDTKSNIFFLLEISINWFNRILPIVSIEDTNFELKKYIAHGIRIYMDVHNSVYQQVFHVLKSQKLVNTHSISKIREIIVHILIFTFLETFNFVRRNSTKKGQNVLEIFSTKRDKTPEFQIKN